MKQILNLEVERLPNLELLLPKTVSALENEAESSSYKDSLRNQIFTVEFHWRSTAIPNVEVFQTSTFGICFKHLANITIS